MATSCIDDKDNTLGDSINVRLEIHDFSPTEDRPHLYIYVEQSNNKKALSTFTHKWQVN